MAGPELTADLSGNPRVEVFFDPADLDPDTARLRMYRLSEGRTWKVRGGVDSAVGVAALDWECPFSVEAAYRAEMFDADGVSLGFTDSSTIVLDYEGTVVHNPLAPDLWVPATPLVDSAGSLGRPMRGSVVETEGDRVGVWVGSGRAGLRGVQMALMVDSLAAADTFQTFQGTYSTPRTPVLCLRSSLGIRWPRTFFFRGDFAEIDRTVKFGGQVVTFEGSVDEVSPPHPGLTPPFLTYEDMEAAYSTYEAAEAAYATYEAAQRDYSLAGLG